MTPERWQQITDIFEAALEREPSERAAFLSEACGTDQALLREVASLVAAHEQASNFIEQPPHDVAAGWHAAATPLHERSFGHYQMLSLLGKGGMGEVWLAKDTLLGRKVALKLLPAEFTADAERVRRFAQEARAASALNHPNIVTIHEIGESANHHYMASEHVEGETLRQRMDRGPLKLQEALDLAIQIATALEAAHRAGIVHRDIKPENVMVRPDGYVKVLDFGLAKLIESSSPMMDAAGGVNTESGVVMGTPRCMSPEQARGEKADARTDIFSLGIVFYEMLTGRAPFTGATRNDLIASILKDEPPPLATLAPATPPDLGRIVGKALEKNREARYQSVPDLLSDLKHLQRDLEFAAEEKKRSGRATVEGEGNLVIPFSGEISRPRTIAPEGQTTKKTANRRRLAALGALAGLVIATAAVWFYLNRSPVLTSKDTILLADFENKTGEEVFDDTLKQGLAMHFEQAPFVHLFPEARIRQTLRLMGRPPNERVTTEIARAICVREGIKASIAGSIAPLGSHYVITLEAINGQSGESLARQQAEAENKEQVLRALSQAATGLREKLGESLGSIRQLERVLEDATTSNLEAFKLHYQAVALAVSGRVMEAIPFWKRAVELDPNFAYAWSALSIAHFGTGRPGLAAEYATRAYALRDRVSEFEQLRLAHRYHYLVTGELHKAIEALLLQKRMYPRVSTASGDLACTYYWIGQTDQAIAEAHESFRLYPNFFISRLYWGLALLRLNRFAEAREVLAQAIEQNIDHPDMRSALYQLAYVSGDAAGMQQQIDWARERPDEYLALDWQTGAAAFAGQWRRAQELSRRAIDLAGHDDTKEVAARYATEQALRLSVLSSHSSLPSPENRKLKLEVQTLAKNALKLARGRDSLPRAALALAFCGETDQAKPLVEELTKRYPEATVIHSISLPVIRAAIDLRRSNTAGAIEQLQTASRYEAAAEFWPQYLRGEAFLKLKQGAEAATEFQKILDHRGQAPLSPLYPLAHLGSARSAALSGDLTKSRAAYAEFFKMWQSADADLPILIEAKKEYEKHW